MLAAYLPGVTAGIGAMWAGHVSNHRNLDHVEFQKPKTPDTVVHVHTPSMYYRQERLFLIAGGIIKVMYYVGAFILLFVLTKLTPFGTGRGGLTFILKPVFVAEPGDYFVLISAAILSGCISFIILTYLTEFTIKILPYLNLKMMYLATLVMIFVVIYFMGGGWIGLGVMCVTTCIGMIPVFYNCRRSHCMAVLLVPVTLNMAGYGDVIISFLRLG